MTNEEKFYALLQQRYNEVFLSIPVPSPGDGLKEYEKHKIELGIRWDDFLNKLKIKRIDSPKKPVAKGWIRIQDPHWRRHKRVIEISEDEALLYLTLGFVPGGTK